MSNWNCQIALFSLPIAIHCQIAFAKFLYCLYCLELNLPIMERGFPALCVSFCAAIVPTIIHLSTSLLSIAQLEKQQIKRQHTKGYCSRMAFVFVKCQTKRFKYVKRIHPTPRMRDSVLSPPLSRWKLLVRNFLLWQNLNLRCCSTEKRVNFQNTLKYLVMMSSLMKRSQVRVGSHQGGALVIYVGPIT